MLHSPMRLQRTRFTSALLLVAAGCEPEGESSSAPAVEAGEELSGGDTTVFDESREAFARPARNLDDKGREVFALGDHLFGRTWVTAPASAAGTDGLGPLFNSTNCSGCHFKDGRGKPPQEGNDFVGLLLRLSIPGVNEDGGPLAEPNYGGQLNPFGILGVAGEAAPRVVYEDLAGSYGDGEPFSLRRPRYFIESPAYGPLDPQVLVSPRVAPAMIGLGLLEALEEQTILALSDPEDADADGISGRPNYVYDVAAGQTALGRFGWKANQPTVLQQTAGAFLGDLGITSSLFPEESCTAAQLDCKASPTGGSPELDESKLTNIAYYSKTLAVPARRNVGSSAVLRGRGLFREMGCGGCHAFALLTGDLTGHPELSRQKIWPYTDLLLHDMGEGLADNRPDFLASGAEWRTAPLWGIGLQESVNKHTFFLHDGRARNLAEAILWHGGEGEAAREAFRMSSSEDREDLMLFLESL
jgi:CxxC motif-containing protein (DUF1111 family)